MDLRTSSPTGALGLLAALALLVASAPAAGAPVRGQITLSIGLRTGIGLLEVTSTGTVEVTGDAIHLPADVLLQTSPITIGSSGTTAISTFKASGIRNRSATFSLGGITGQLPDELCTGPTPGDTCNRGGAIGGALGLSGTVFVSVIQSIVMLPIRLGTVGVGQGVEKTGQTLGSPSAFNAGFTTGQAFFSKPEAAGRLLSPPMQTLSGGLTPDGRLALVSPSYIQFAVFDEPLPMQTTLIVPIPEPTTFLLLGLGLTGLAGCLRRRR